MRKIRITFLENKDFTHNQENSKKWLLNTNFLIYLKELKKRKTINKRILEDLKEFINFINTHNQEVGTFKLEIIKGEN